ncbi:glycosyltransferase [Lacisediminihabitans profunda]|uniref:Glycosyltransferase n=1 Tax=Lacisediminihabitans profunda TaxID=2594790 RepID=A0A5C8UKF5_9MICO|nr:glycosyltransferase [Lacisediminihabitans profunda]TXN28244.1 glycosyltransferase [Lacisediminihabitans profunda]
MNRAKAFLRKVALRLFPANSRSRRLLAAFYWTYKGGSEAFAKALRDRPLYRGKRSGLRTYAAWRRQERKISTASNDLAMATSFAVIIERDGPRADVAVAATVRSVQRQIGTRATVFPVSSGISMADALAPVSQDFVLFLKAGSLLASGALTEIAKLHRVDPALKLIGFDSDERGPLGMVRNPRFRPEWSPEMLLGVNYFGRAFAIKRNALLATGAAVVSDRGIWRVLLASRLESRVVGRLPRVLLTEPAGQAAPLTVDDAEMVRAVLEELGEKTEVTIDSGDVARVRFLPDQWPSVSVVIPTRHSRANLGRLLPSLASTDYPRFDVRVVDNGGHTTENDEWYSANSHGLSLAVDWWVESPFNYSRVNNHGARSTDGEIILFLNDDTQIVDPGWLREMVGALLREGVGTVGVQHRQAEGLIQHGGVLVGPGGFADNLFSGMRPGSDTLIGPTSWYRNALAVTGACVAVRRTDFERVGGLDERFILTGSDVVLGLDQVIQGRRNVVLPFDLVRHFESLTRGTAIPPEDFYASYFRYHPWLQNGDPYSSPSVSRLSARPTFNNRKDVAPVRLALEAVGRVFANLAQSSGISSEANSLMYKASISSAEVDAVHALHAENADFREIRTVNWFVPDIDMPFFGGLNTAFRLADKLARDHGVANRFVMMAARNEAYVAGALAAAFPGLAGSELFFYDGSDGEIATIPPADAAVATLWLTAAHVAKAPGVKRKFYLMQDYEPGFYPASTMFAMAEESYRLGLYGICNTVSMHKIYTESYEGEAMYFTPAVDQSIYNAVDRREKGDDEPVTIFAYARDHFRNCWELVFAALSEIKRIHGDGVRIVAAGARYLPESADFIDMGLLDYRATGALYRETDIGVTMQISRHPSYLPLELMSSGVAMVAPDSHWFRWLFRGGKNSVLTRRTYDDLVNNIDLLIRDKDLRQSVSRESLATIASDHSDWDVALDGVFGYMVNPQN